MRTPLATCRRKRPARIEILQRAVAKGFYGYTTIPAMLSCGRAFDAALIKRRSAVLAMNVKRIMDEGVDTDGLDIRTAKEGH